MNPNQREQLNKLKSCSVEKNFPSVREIRAGNFYDVVYTLRVIVKK